MKFLSLIGTLFLAINSSSQTIQVQTVDPICGLANGSAIAYGSGGVQPYSWSWSNGATTAEIDNLAPGTYTVTMTDANNTVTSTNIQVADIGSGPHQICASNGGLHSCHGLCNQGYWIDHNYNDPWFSYTYGIPENMEGPLSFDPPLDLPPAGWPNSLGAYTGRCIGDDIPFTVYDHNTGCTLSFELIASCSPNSAPTSDPTPMSIVSVVGSCPGENHGEVTVDLGLDNSGYAPAWSARILDASSQPIAGGGLSGYPANGWNITTKTGLAPGSYFVERVFGNQVTPCSDVVPFTIPALSVGCVNMVQLSVDLFLGGPYDPGAGLMSDALRSLGYIPLTSPYSNPPDVPPTTSSSVLSVTGNNAVVDWVIIELRDPAAQSSPLTGRYGLVQRDGDVVDPRWHFTLAIRCT